MSGYGYYERKPEDVGEILVKVQEDLLQLKEKILSENAGQDIDISALEQAIAKTEDGLQSQSELVLNQINNQVQMIPFGPGQRGKARDAQVSFEATYDLKGGQGKTGGTAKRIPETKLGSEILQTTGPTPGQSVKFLQQLKAMANPYNSKNREVMNENYGIQLPLISEKRPHPPGMGRKTILGSTIEPLAVLPAANRHDPQLLPPPITEDDAKRGILSLLQRGLIPPAAELHLEPSPVVHRTVPLHDPAKKEYAKVPPERGDIHLNAVRLDPNIIPVQEERASSAKSSCTILAKSAASRCTSAESGSVRRPPGKKNNNSKGVEMSGQPLKLTHPWIMPPPTTPASAADFKDKTYRFAIQHGKVREQTPEFLNFKQHYCLSWGSIVTMLKHLEKMLTNYAVPIAFINGDKLADLSLEFELEQFPTTNDLLSVIVNKEDVENIINRPGRRYMGPKGKDIAATKIQAMFRMYRERTQYLEFRRKKWAAGVIAITWIMHVKLTRVQRQLKAHRMDQLEAFRRRALILSKKWDTMKKSKRVIIHIPSMGHTQKLRQTVDEMGLQQNLQMARLADIRDPNVDVIYVAPVPINEEMVQYYTKLLGLKSAIDSGDVDNQSDLSDRYKIITPEAIKSFPSHHMCLSTHLKYSPKTLKRIKNLIKGRDAYIVTGVPHKDDIHVADVLDVPILCSEPEIAHLYSTKSGNKRIFASANVPVPPGEFDVYSLSQIHECLAQLVTENLEVTRWLFKLDDEFNGRGIAYLDVAEHMPCYAWALKECQRYGEKWNKKWAQEAAYIKINAEIPSVLEKHGTPVNTKAYKTWEIFLNAFLSEGGVIEACPPSDSVTALTVDMLIEPTGNVVLVSNGDQIHEATPFTCWGLSVPQSSVEPEELNSICFKVAEACKTRGVVGYFTIDFVTFIHPKTMNQEIWAIDLDLNYTDTQVMFGLMEFVTGGVLDPKTHYFDIIPVKKEEKKSRRRRTKVEEEVVNTNRYAVMSTHLRHTNLSVVHYSVFFQMCRAHGIGYDIKEKQGTIFTLVDSTNRENLGMITVGDNLQGALATFARNLSVIHQEISAPNMQGQSNFKPVIEDIEGILGTTVMNAEEQDEVDNIPENQE